MAIAVAVLSTILPNPLDKTQQQVKVYGTMTLTANYGGASTHGDTANLAGIAPSNQLPIYVRIWEAPASGTAPLGYSYTYCPGTTQANGVVAILGTGAASGQGGTEITEASAYSTFTPSLNNAVLYFEAAFPLFV